MDIIEAFTTKKTVVKEASFPKAEYEDRLKRVRAKMAEQGLDCLLVNNTPSMCWLSGYQTPMADWYNCLIVPAKGDLTLQICDVGLGVVNTYTVAHFHWVRWDTMSGEAARQLMQILKDYDIDKKRVGVEMRRPGLDPYTFEQLKRTYPNTEFVDASDLTLKLRAVKSPAEIESLRKAAKMTSAGMAAACAALKPGVTENTLGAAAAAGMIEAGSEYFSISPFVRSGVRSAMVHATFKNTLIEPGDSVVLEMGAVHNRFTAPLYRTAIIGNPPDQLRRLVDAALETLELLYANVRPGRTMDEATQAAAKRLKQVKPEADYNENHAYSVGIGFPPDWVEHSVFIRPGSQDVLKPGMTFHTPRSFRVPGVLSTGFSETILVTDTGCEVLTQHPRRLHVA